MQVTVEEAKADLADLMDAAVRGETVLITRETGQSVQLVPQGVSPRKSNRHAGSVPGIVIAPDFDEPLSDFADYM